MLGWFLKRRRFSKHAGGIARAIRELIETARGANDRPVPDKTRQRFRADAVGGKVLQPHHRARFQQLERLGALRVHGCRDVMFPRQIP